VNGKQDTYFVRHYCDSHTRTLKLTLRVCLALFVDNIYVVFGDKVFQESVDIPKGTNCAPLLVDLFLYSYEAEFVQKLLWDKKKTP
jgi:hypothetical protein